MAEREGIFKILDNSAAMNEALSAPAEDEDAGSDPDDTVNEARQRIERSRLLTAVRG